MVFSVMVFSTVRSASRVRIVPVTRIQETVARDLHGACDLHACGLHTARDVQEVEREAVLRHGVLDRGDAGSPSTRRAEALTCEVHIL